jgi:hypothetical protein
VGEITARARLLSTVALAVGALAFAPGVARAQFGIASFATSVSSAQAGAHADVTTSFELQTEALGNPLGQLKNAAIALPPGLVGNPQAIERCSIKSLQGFECAHGSQVGVMTMSLLACRGASVALEATAQAGATTVSVANANAFCTEEPGSTVTIGEGASAEQAQIARIANPTTLELVAPLANAHAAGEHVTHIATASLISLPLFNVQPSAGHVATLATSLLIADVYVQVNVEKDGRLTATISETPELFPVRAGAITLWGVPASPSHNALRCNELDFECGPSTDYPAAFMTNPSTCGVPLEAAIEATTWEGEAASSTAALQPLTGCEALAFAPSLSVVPSTTQRDTPAGYEVALKLPQQEQPYAVATADIHDMSVTLPQGASLSPALGNGLQACTEAQFEAAAGCPSASMLGLAKASSPLLGEGLNGAVYLGMPTSTERYRVFVRLSGANATIDFAGQVEPDEHNGQVTAVFDDVPQLPLSELELAFFGGPSAAFANPPACGTATSTAQISSSAGQSASPSSTFTVGPDAEEGQCPSSLPFAPGFTAGSISALGGEFSPFTLTVSRNDGQQMISSLTAQLPPGLAAMLSQVPLCAEAQAAAGSCPSQSQIGTTAIGAGAGAQPLYLPGMVYLTGPYDGAPFGLSIVVPATAGPLNLGTIVVRARILVNASTMQMTIASDPLPQIVDGIPLRLRVMSLNMNRAGFMFNPSNCAPGTVAGTIDSAEGASVAVTSPFQLAGCAGLAFAPRLAATTEARASSQGNGASLDVQLTDATGAQANISSVTAELPGRLRPRLSTIQQACRATTFAAEPASCPESSRVGSTTITTPVLPVPLRGSVYLVARGASAYPELMTALESQGIKAALNGAISISSRDAVTIAFKGLPDVPISSFVLALPQGPHSMLGAIENLCSGRLEMPYTITGANGARIRQSSRVAVKGCIGHGPKRRAKRGGSAASRRR